MKKQTYSKESSSKGEFLKHFSQTQIMSSYVDELNNKDNNY